MYRRPDEHHGTGSCLLLLPPCRKASFMPSPAMDSNPPELLPKISLPLNDIFKIQIVYKQVSKIL